MTAKDDIAALNLAIDALGKIAQKYLTFDANLYKGIPGRIPPQTSYIKGQRDYVEYQKYVKAMSVLEHLRERIKAQKGLF